MNRVLAGGLLAALVTVPVFAALKQGDTAPDFSAKASLAGKETTFSLKDALNKGPVVVYFYPSAFTGGATFRRTRSPRTRSNSTRLAPRSSGSLATA